MCLWSTSTARGREEEAENRDVGEHAARKEFQRTQAFWSESQPLNWSSVRVAKKQTGYQVTGSVPTNTGYQLYLWGLTGSPSSDTIFTPSSVGATWRKHFHTLWSDAGGSETHQVWFWVSVSDQVWFWVSVSVQVWFWVWHTEHHPAQTVYFSLVFKVIAAVLTLYSEHRVFYLCITLNVVLRNSCYDLLWLRCSSNDFVSDKSCEKSLRWGNIKSCVSLQFFTK